MPCSTFSSLAISTSSSAYFIVWIICPPMLKSPSPSRVSLVRHSLYNLNVESYLELFASTSNPDFIEWQTLVFYIVLCDEFIPLFGMKVRLISWGDRFRWIHLQMLNESTWNGFIKQHGLQKQEESFEQCSSWAERWNLTTWAMWQVTASENRRKWRQAVENYATRSRGELIYLAPLGSENISAPYFKQCFFRGGYYPPDSQTPRLPVPRQK